MIHDVFANILDHACIVVFVVLDLLTYLVQVVEVRQYFRDVFEICVYFQLLLLLQMDVYFLI